VLAKSPSPFFLLYGEKSTRKERCWNLESNGSRNCITKYYINSIALIITVQYKYSIRPIEWRQKESSIQVFFAKPALSATSRSYYRSYTFLFASDAKIPSSPQPPPSQVQWMWWQHAACTCVELWFGGGKGIVSVGNCKKQTLCKDCICGIAPQGGKANNNLPVQQWHWLTPQSWQVLSKATAMELPVYNSTKAY